MDIAEELRKIHELHETGALTDEEFAQAKAAIIHGDRQPQLAASERPALFPIDPYEGLTLQRLLTMRIIAGALLGGVVVFLGIVLYIVNAQHAGGGAAPPQALPMQTLMAGIFLAIMAPLAFVVPATMTRFALRQILVGTYPAGNNLAFATGGAQLMGLRQTTLIVGLALLEGLAFFGCIAYLLEANPIALGVVGVAIALMLGKFPTQARVRAWLDRQAEVLNELRLHQDATPDPKQF